MAYVMQIVAPAIELPADSEFMRPVGEWLVDCDLRDDGLLDGLVTTPDRSRARRFEHATEGLAYWRRESGRTRPDGKPDRPLTAYSVSLETL